jgi:hypothetical protein
MNIDTEIKFKPIPGVDAGITHLTIRCKSARQFTVFVGGCAVGNATSLAAAKQLLLDRARAYCTRQIVEAKAFLEHYEAQRARLSEEGLTQ